MKFLLNDEICEEVNVQASLSLLRYLRENKGLSGTKEGCASGDCGACTVMLGELRDGTVRYQNINACITPVQAIAGKHLVTVEHLASTKALHPSQRAMVDHHGSQCGFCTPGFVMSLCTLFEQTLDEEQKITRESVCEAISGNLCRCTGYRPIIDAGLNMDLHSQSKLFEARDDTTRTLNQIHTSQDQDTAINYFIPESEQALQQTLKSKPKAKLIAGATDLMLEVTQQYQDIELLIDVTRIPSMARIIDKGGDIHIGASVTYSQLEHYFADKHTSLFHLFERIAAKQIRNRGTIGGNIANASPIADLPPVLLALDSVVVLVNTDGNTRHIPIESFYHAYKVTELKSDEYISHFIIPRATLDDESQFLKVSKRIEDDISSVMMATRFKVDNGKILASRIAYGGMAATPVRVSAAEAVFENKSIDDASTIEHAIDALRASLKPLSDVRASAQYRLDMACNLLRKSYLSLNKHALPLVSRTIPSIEQEAP